MVVLPEFTYASAMDVKVKVLPALDGVDVGVGVRVALGVGVCVAVGVAVGVRVGVLVAVGAPVGVRVGVCVVVGVIVGPAPTARKLNASTSLASSPHVLPSKYNVGE